MVSNINIKFESIYLEEIPPLESSEPVSKEKKFVNQEHKLIKDLKKRIDKEEWQEAFKIYQKELSKETREEIQELVYQRDKMIPFKTGISMLNAETMIDQFFLCKNETETYAFLKIYFLPALQQILIKNYEIDKTQTHMDHANKVFSAVRAQFPISPNYPKRDQELENLVRSRIPDDKFFQAIYHDEATQLRKKLKDYRDSDFPYFSQMPVIKSSNFLTLISSIQILKDLKIGNCFEMSYAGLHEFLLDKTIKRVEVFRIFKDGQNEGGDHAFIVINRKKNSDVSDFTTWGTHCLILDSWKKDGPHVFPAFEIPKYLFDCEGIDKNTSDTFLRKFDPFSDGLALLDSDIYSVNDFESSVDYRISEDVSALEWLESKLTAFHLAKGEAKISIAKEIIADHPKGISKKNKVITKDLIAQMRCFINPHYAEMFNIGPITHYSPIENVKINERFFENYVSSVTISYLLNIADLAHNNQIDKVFKKIQKLDPKLKNSITKKFNELKKNHPNLNEQSIPLLFTDAIYSWVQEQAKTAEENGKIEEAKKIIAFLPKKLRKCDHASN